MLWHAIPTCDALQPILPSGTPPRASNRCAQGLMVHFLYGTHRSQFTTRCSGTNSFSCPFALVSVVLRMTSTFDHLQQDVPLVPLYTTVKKAPSTQPEPTSYDRPPPLVAYPSVQALNYHGQQPAYSRAPAPSAFGVPPGTTVPGHSRSSVPVTTTPSQPYSRTVDVRRHSPAAPGTGGWGRESSTASGTTTSSGELVRSHRIPHSPYPFPNFHSASPLTTVSHGGRDGGSEARQINEGAWPQHQAHPEHSGAQSSNGASPLVPPNDNGHER